MYKIIHEFQRNTEYEFVHFIFFICEYIFDSIYL